MQLLNDNIARVSEQHPDLGVLYFLNSATWAVSQPNTSAGLLLVKGMRADKHFKRNGRPHMPRRM